MGERKDATPKAGEEYKGEYNRLEVYEKDILELLSHYIQKEDLPLIIRALKEGETDPILDPKPTFHRIDETEKLLWQLALEPLTKEEALVLETPEKANLKTIKEDLIHLCLMRYSRINFFPDLSLVGIDFKRAVKLPQRVFAIGF